MNQLVARATNGLNRNTGFLILIAIVLFGFAILGFQKDNKVLLEDTRETTINTNSIIRGQRDILCLLVVHAEESEDVVITQDVKDLCGDIFRTPTSDNPTTRETPSDDEQPVDPEPPIIQIPEIEVPTPDEPFCILGICL